MAQRPDRNHDGSETTSPVSPEDDAFAARRPYRRRHSQVSLDPQQSVAGVEDDVADASLQHHEAEAYGLGFNNIPADQSRVRQIPVGVRRNTSQHPVDIDTSGRSETTVNNPPHYRTESHDSFYNNGKSLGGQWDTPHSSRYSLKDNLLPPSTSDVSLLSHQYGSSSEVYCPAHGDLLHPRWSWWATIIVTLSIFSTVFSGIYLGIALARPRWGTAIGTTGHVTFATATLLTALFSKAIEVSFVTVAVAILGQVLSRRAFTKGHHRHPGGISIAEVNLRLWIMQPGTLLTSWVGVRYAVTTILGAITLAAAISALFYTSAAEALVSPKLRMGKNASRVLGGKVTASYANTDYLATSCKTPIAIQDDSYAGTTCLEIEHAGNGYRNFAAWNGLWTERIASGQTHAGESSYASRVPPVATMFENTTILGQWITPGGANVTLDSHKYGRFVQNVTMAMPMTNLFHAVRDPVNTEIIQPEELQGSGEYYVKASIPAPALNVLCVGASEQEIAPLLANNTDNEANPWPFATELDDIFGWANTSRSYAPVFGKAPIEYNTVVNITQTWGPDAVYLLARPSNATVTEDYSYMLCSLKSMQYPNCTTAYHAAQAGGELSVYCDDHPENTLPYSARFRDDNDHKPPTGFWEPNWKDVGVTWILSVSLSVGITDGNASIARLLTQMVPGLDANLPTPYMLNPGLPSLAEGLAVLADCTLLLSSEAAPFIHWWNYSSEVFALQEPQYQYFPASLSYTDYASGVNGQRGAGVFYVILATVFALNCVCFVFLIRTLWSVGQVTDFTEPQNLFSLAINSPPSHVLAGACGGGPRGEMLSRRFQVDMANRPPASSTAMAGGDVSTAGYRHQSLGGPHFYVRYTDDEKPLRAGGAKAKTSPDPRSSRFPSQHWPRHRHRLSATEPLTENDDTIDTGQDFIVDDSPAVQQYNTLIGRRSWH